MNRCRRNFSPPEFRGFLTWSSTIKGAMDKWRLQLDVTYQKDLETTLEVLIIVQSGTTGAEEVRAEFFAS
jgi:hypothetical protein